MPNLRTDSNGYSVVELLLIVVVVAIVGFVAWFVHHETTKANATYSVSQSQPQPSKKAVQAKTTTKSSQPAATSTTPSGQQ